MNILPHKSWHVYNKKNIEKVKRDEAKAQAEEAAKADRAVKAESEARLNLLRQRADARHKQLGDPSASDTAVVTKAVEHVVLFGSDHGGPHAENEERAAEEKEKEAKLERQLTMYLDKGVKDTAPWYALDEYDRYGPSKPHQGKVSEAKERRRKRAIHLDEDPLAEIRSKMAKKDEARKERRYSAHRHHRDKKPRSSSSSSSTSPSSTSIEALRAKRLQREQAERVRTKAYVYGTVPDIKPPEHYHSQFNPVETAEAHERRRKRRR